MKVLDCIETYKTKFRTSTKKPTKVWLCPNNTIHARIGVEYTTTFDIRSTVSSVVADLDVIKHWVEGDSVCIIFRNSADIQSELFETKE